MKRYEYINKHQTKNVKGAIKMHKNGQKIPFWMLFVGGLDHINRNFRFKALLFETARNIF